MSFFTTAATGTWVIVVNVAQNAHDAKPTKKKTCLFRVDSPYKAIVTAVKFVT
jgi:hypothetical protein